VDGPPESEVPVPLDGVAVVDGGRLRSTRRLKTLTFDSELQDSPSSKLLYAKDIPRYRQMVTSFYKSVEESSPVTEQHVADFARQHSQVDATACSI